LSRARAERLIKREESDAQVWNLGAEGEDDVVEVA